VTAVFPARTANGRVHQNVLHAAVFYVVWRLKKVCFIVVSFVFLYKFVE